MTLNKFAVDRLAEVFYLMFMDRLDDLDDMLVFSRRCVSGWDDASLDQLDKILLQAESTTTSNRKEPHSVKTRWGLFIY